MTDALTGLIVQPSFVLEKIFQLLGDGNSERIEIFLSISLWILFMNLFSASFSAGYVREINCDQIFTVKYLNIITERKIKIAVTMLWIISFIFGAFFSVHFLAQLLPFL